MNIKQAKQIPLEDFLGRLGYAPNRRLNGQLWYHSPLRAESTPSFKVNTRLNAWYDFGRGEGGDILDLVMRLENIGPISDALDRIEELVGSLPLPARAPNSADVCDVVQSLELTSIERVHSKSLIAYLQRRGINPELVAAYVQEAHYRRGRNSHFALAFANKSGGYELRSPYFKGTLGAKDISVFAGNLERILVFEGFFDFLTAVAMHGGMPDATAIILNSVNMRERAIDLIRRIKPAIVELYRDNDSAGEQALGAFRKALPEIEIIDKSEVYRRYDDLNAWHTAKSRSGAAGTVRL